MKIENIIKGMKSGILDYLNRTKARSEYARELLVNALLEKNTES